MMAGNPTNWWSLIMNPQSSSSATSSHFYGASNDNQNQDFPCSLSQLLVSGVSGEEEKFGISLFHEENSEDQSLNSVHIPNFRVPVIAAPEVGQLYNYVSLQQLPTDFTKPNSWSQLQATSCITNIFNLERKVEPKYHHSSDECNGTSSKKARVQHSSPQPSLKVRKEKLGDRITALHQIVSPFGKTDTASVLSEAIGYIRFLQAQIQALSSPYLGNASAGSMGHILQHSDSQHKAKDLRSRGLCLVPISCMQNIASDTGADYWSPALGGSGF